MTHYWFWKKWQPDRNGQPCNLLIAHKGKVLVEFEDGHKVVAPRWAIRRLK